MIYEGVGAAQFGTSTRLKVFYILASTRITRGSEGNEVCLALSVTSVLCTNKTPVTIDDRRAKTEDLVRTEWSVV